MCIRDRLTTEISDLAIEQGEVANSTLEREAQRLVEIIDSQTTIFTVTEDRAERVIEFLEYADDTEDLLHALRVTDESEDEEDL